MSTAMTSGLTTGLDDRTFDDLVSEAVTLLPTLAPEWTNHNPSDPGITLVELLAYFTEMLVYRLGCVAPTTMLQFLKLLGGANWQGLSGDSKLQFLRLLMGNRWDGWKIIGQDNDVELEKEIDCAVLQASSAQLEKALEYVMHELLQDECAVTAQDFERIACKAARDYLGPETSVRALCVPSVNLEDPKASRYLRSDPAHVTVVVVPESNGGDDAAARLYEKVRQELLARSLLTTRVHVVPPVYIHLAIGLRLAPRTGQSLKQLTREVRDALERRFGPEPGQGPMGKGWPFGRDLRISEIVEAVDEIAGVDYVEEVAILQISVQEEDLPLPQFALGIQIGLRSTVGVDSMLGVSRALGPDRLRQNDRGNLVAIVLRPWELLRVTIADEDIRRVKKQTTGKEDGADTE
jgi:hypothetical protein